MTGITTTNQKRMLLLSGRAYPELTDEIATCLGIEPTPTTLYDFANGEIFVPSSGSWSPSAAATRSCCRATPRRSISGSWNT